MIRAILDLILGWLSALRPSHRPGPDERRIPPAILDPEPAPDLEPEPELEPPPVTMEIDEPEPEPVRVEIVEPEPEPEPEPRTISVGAWVGQASFAKPERDVAFCVANGIDTIQIIVNDHSRWRSRQTFDTYPTERIVGLANAAHDAGVAVELMSWIMPHSEYIDRAALRLRELQIKTRATVIELDAEEPWTQARGAMDYGDAAALIAEAFADRDFELGCNFIGYTPVSKVGPLAESCDFGRVQAYSTSSNTLAPETVVERLAGRNLAKMRTRIEVGLAAYRQRGIPGHTTHSAMGAAFEGAKRFGCSSIRYWSLRWIRSAPDVARFIAGADRTLPERPGVLA